MKVLGLTMRCYTTYNSLDLNLLKKKQIVPISVNGYRLDRSKLDLLQRA